MSFSLNMEQQTDIQQFSGAEELLSRREFKKALDKLTQLDSGALSASDYAHFCILEAEARLYLGDYALTDILNCALDYYKQGNDNEKYARAKFLNGWMLESQGKRAEAREALLESYLCYKRSGNLEDAVRPLNRLAYIAHLAGDIDSAISSLLQCIDIYQALNNDKGAITFSNNLAAVYRLSGMLKKSIEQYKYSEKYFCELSDDYRYHYYLGIALATALKGNIENAIRFLNQTSQFPDCFAREKAHYYEFLGWIRILEGYFKEAEESLKSGLKLSLEIAPESDLISQTKRLLADAYLGLKKFDLAQKHGEEALIVAEKINERAEIAACYRVFAQVCLHNDQRDKAKEWFRKAMDLFSMIKSRYELAVTRYLFASSGLCDHNERTAQLYLAKEYFESEEIKPYVDKVNKALTSSVAPKPIEKPSGNGAPVFIAKAASTKKIVALAEQIAPFDMTVLLTGPTGAGKDQLAKYIHWFSGRKGNFVPVNCAAIPDGMLESELFGFKSGAFTGAHKDKPGLIEMAHEGTFYFNEIGDMPYPLQAKLLEFMESKQVRRLGSIEAKKVDVRLIAATNQNLPVLIKENRFRSDLYYRLNQLEIQLPALWERKEDIPELIRLFLRDLGLNPSHDDNPEQLNELGRILSSRDWPGNVRELENEVRSLYSLSGGDPGRIVEHLRVCAISERDKLLQILEQTQWNRSEAARRLGISEGTIRNKMRQFGIQDPRLV